ncbi:UNVERIFIED_CONTAM: hypothetical protein O8I53_06165 [Campylobacter lari]
MNQNNYFVDDLDQIKGVKTKNKIQNANVIDFTGRVRAKQK